MQNFKSELINFIHIFQKFHAQIMRHLQEFSVCRQVFGDKANKIGGWI